MAKHFSELFIGGQFPGGRRQAEPWHDYFVGAEPDSEAGSKTGTKRDDGQIFRHQSVRHPEDDAEGEGDKVGRVNRARVVGEHANQRFGLRYAPRGTWRPESIPSEFEKGGDETSKAACQDGRPLVSHGMTSDGEELFEQWLNLPWHKSQLRWLRPITFSGPYETASVSGCFKLGSGPNRRD